MITFKTYISEAKRKPWAVVSSPYGSWNIEGYYNTKRDALNWVQMEIGTDRRPRKEGTGYWIKSTAGPEYFILKTINLGDNGYE